MKRILIVLGTRPEAIKLAPLIKECKKKKNFSVTVVNTQQHRHLTYQALNLFTITPDISLNVMKKNQTLSGLTSVILQKMKIVLQETKPDIVLVQGDTTTAFAGALAAYYEKIPVGHIEAGLRTYDIFNPYPEEVNRRNISTIATLHFAPTKHAMQNLLSEHVEKKRIFVTGNTIIDAVQLIKKESRKKVSKEKLILVTTHRRESFDTGIKQILKAITHIAEAYTEFTILLPIHPNPTVQIEIRKHIKKGNNITLTDPLDYTEMINLLEKSYLVITDSGGIQEEAPAFHTPVLVARDTTERPEGISAGCAKLVGTKTSAIVNETGKLITNRTHYTRMSQTKNPYGDGKASERIVKILTKHI